MGEARSLVNAAGFRLDYAVLNLIGHAEPLTAAEEVGFQEKIDGRVELLAIDRYRRALFKTNDDLFAFDLDIIAPESGAHDGIDDFDGRGKMFQIFGFMGCAKDVGVCRIGFFC